MDFTVFEQGVQNC